MNEADERFLMRALRNVQIELKLKFQIVGYCLDVDHHGLDIAVEKMGGSNLKHLVGLIAGQSIYRRNVRS